MRCPFLRETQVKSCQVSVYRTMIASSPFPTERERCLSTEYVHCPATRQYHGELPSRSHCPFFQESLVQYCSAAPVTKYIPYTDSLLSRCTSGRHRYCDLYLGLSRPPIDTTATPEMILVPDQLCFSQNHFWFDRMDDGTFLIGIDGLLAHLLGDVTQVTFLTSHGLVCPEVVFTTAGVDIHLAFPAVVSLTGINVQLRSTPGRCSHDPYGSGWLFEGTCQQTAESSGDDFCRDFLQGDDARQWMRNEVTRTSVYLQEIRGRLSAAGEPVVNDGGIPDRGIAQHLNREDTLMAFSTLFSHHPTLRR